MSINYLTGRDSFPSWEVWWSAKLYFQLPIYTLVECVLRSQMVIKPNHCQPPICTYTLVEKASRWQTTIDELQVSMYIRLIEWIYVFVTKQAVSTFDFHYVQRKRVNLDNGRLSIEPLSRGKSTLRSCSTSGIVTHEHCLQCAWFTESGARFLLNHGCQHPTPNNSTLFGHPGPALESRCGTGNTNHKVWSTFWSKRLAWLPNPCPAICQQSQQTWQGSNTGTKRPQLYPWQPEREPQPCLVVASETGASMELWEKRSTTGITVANSCPRCWGHKRIPNISE